VPQAAGRGLIPIVLRVPAWVDDNGWFGILVDCDATTCTYEAYWPKSLRTTVLIPRSVLRQPTASDSSGNRYPARGAVRL
jgi:hypothetical protein